MHNRSPQISTARSLVSWTSYTGVGLVIFFNDLTFICMEDNKKDTVQKGLSYTRIYGKLVEKKKIVDID